MASPFCSHTTGIIQGEVFIFPPSQVEHSSSYLRNHSVSSFPSDVEGRISLRAGN